MASHPSSLKKVKQDHLFIFEGRATCFAVMKMAAKSKQEADNKAVVQCFKLQKPDTVRLTDFGQHAKKNFKTSVAA